MSNLSNVNVNGTKYVIKDKMLNDSGFYTEQAAFSTLNLTADATADNCKLKADGTSASDSSYRLRKYRVNDGEIVYVNLSKDSDGVCQFQNNTNVPSSSNTYIVGDVVTNAVNAYLPVPSGVTYLIVSELKTNSTNIVGLGVNRIEQASCDIDTMQTGYIAIESGSYKDGNGLIKVKNVNRLRNVAPVCVHDLAAVRFPSGYSAWCFYFDKTLTYIGFSNAWLTGTVPVSTFASGTEYITFGIKNNSTPNSDISSEASTVANGITLKQGKLDVDVLPYAVQHDYNEVIKSVSRIADGLTVPHQSIVGFTTAYKYGFRAMLCDLRFTSDNVPVLEHDAYLNQHYSDVYLNGSLVTANTVEIASTTYENLLQYDFGYYKGSAYANTRIMTFEQMLDLCKKLGCEVHIETKTDLTSTQYGIVFGLIRQYGMEKKTVWNPQSVSQMNSLIDYEPNVYINLHSNLSSGNALTDSMVTSIISAVNDYNRGHVSLTLTYGATMTTAQAERLSDAGVGIMGTTFESSTDVTNYYAQGKPYTCIESALCTGTVIAGKVLFETVIS